MEETLHAVDKVRVGGGPESTPKKKRAGLGRRPTQRDKHTMSGQRTVMQLAAGPLADKPLTIDAEGRPVMKGFLGLDPNNLTRAARSFKRQPSNTEEKPSS
jgi:hypothetical protein